MPQKSCFTTGLTYVRQFSLNHYPSSKFESSSLVKHRYCLQECFWSVSSFFIFNQNYETSYGTSYLSLFQSFLIKLCCYPKSFNKIWKHHILDLHHNSSSTDGARFFLAVQSLESSVLLDIFWFFAKQLLTTVPLHLFVPEHFLWYPVFWELPPWN